MLAEKNIVYVGFLPRVYVFIYTSMSINMVFYDLNLTSPDLTVITIIKILEFYYINININIQVSRKVECRKIKNI